MALSARSLPTLRGPRLLPGSAPLTLTSVAVVGAGLLMREARQARVDVRAMREQGRRVPVLHLDLSLPGREPTRRIAVLGDSSAAGHGLRSPDLSVAHRVAQELHEHDGRGSELCCAALNGADTRAVVDRQLEAARDADIVLIGVGANDAIRGHGPLRVARETLELLEGVRELAAPDVRIVLVTAPDLSVAPGLPAILRPALGGWCRTIARAQTAIADHLDVAVVPLPRHALLPELFGDDGFHPGALGHERTATVILELLRER